MSSRSVSGVPASIMRPRLLTIAIAAVLTCFGLVMIFSASSAEAFSEMGDAAYYVKRQALFIVMGLAGAALVAAIDYHAVRARALFGLMMATLLMLLAVKVAGSGANGATRWIEIGPVRLQPSEFAKLSLVVAGAWLMDDFREDRFTSGASMVGHVLLYIGAPLALIFIQPDKGSTGIIVVVLAAMLVSAKIVPFAAVLALGAVGVILFLGASLGDDYSRQRILTALDPWSDPYGAGYQLTRGFMAFGSGGLVGSGLGMSRMKYSYLPEAHNDFIFAIVGEELGLVGTLAVLALFSALLYFGYQIAKNASDLPGRLIALGTTTLLAVQFFLNAMGVTGLAPLSGKPMPFLSYGGSSIMSCLMMVGLLVNVSRHSALPETVHDARRRAMTLAPEAPEDVTGVGAARPRRGYGGLPLGTPAAGGTSVARPSSASRPSSVPLQVGFRRGGSVPLSSPEEARRGFRVVEGGAGAGRDRIDLGPSAADRLRTQDQGPEVHMGAAARNGRFERQSRGGGSRRPTRRR